MSHIEYSKKWLQVDATFHKLLHLTLGVIFFAIYNDSLNIGLS